MRYFRSVFPDLHYQLVEVSAKPIRSGYAYRATGTQRGAAWGFPPNNRTVTFEGATILYVKDGLVIDRWGAFSFYDILHELGHVPSLWQLGEQLQ